MREAIQSTAIGTPFDRCSPVAPVDYSRSGTAVDTVDAVGALSQCVSRKFTSMVMPASVGSVVEGVPQRLYVDTEPENHKSNRH